MFQKLALLIAFASSSLLSQAQYDEENFYAAKANPFEVRTEDSTFTFKAVNNKQQLLVVQFDNLKAWQTLKINYANLYQTIAKTAVQVESEITDLSRDRNILVRYLNEEQQLLSITENKAQTTVRYLDSGEKSPIKTGSDTIRIIQSKTFSDKVHRISYQFIMDDVLGYQELDLAAFRPFLDSLDQYLTAFILDKNNPYGPNKQIKGLYKTQEGTLHTRNLTLLNQTVGRIFFDYSLGVYSGYNHPIAFIGESTFGIYIDKTQRDNYLFAGVTAGMLNPHVVDNKMEYSGYLALEIGAIPKRKYINIVNGGRLSMALGIYQPMMGGNTDAFFKNKPAFYTGINIPAFKYLQIGLHAASDLKFDQSKQDLSKYLFGISVKASIGSMLNSLYN